MKFDPALSRGLIETFSGLTSDPKELFDLGLKYRSKYIEDGSQIHLQLSMFFVRIASYQNLANFKFCPVYTPETYLMGSLKRGPAFADALKKVRSFAMLITYAEEKFNDLDEKIIEYNEEWSEILPFDSSRKYNYDDFLSESYLLFWKDEDVDDFKWAFEPVEIDDEASELFRDAVMHVLSENIRPDIKSPDPDVIGSWTSDSTCFDTNPELHKPHRNLVRERIQKGLKNPFGENKDEFRFRRSIIPVGPGNFRDAWEPDFDTLFSIRSISNVMRPIVEAIPFSAMYDPIIATKRKRMLRKKDSIYFMMDFKKSAITIPRDLIVIMGECLETLYPDIKEFEYIRSYRNVKVYDKGEWHIPLRGVGLGNMNELYTLMQCAFGYLNKKLFNTDSIFFNDDAVYELNPDRKKDQVIFTLSLIESLGCIVNFAKSVISHSNVFTEEYTSRGDYDYSKLQLLVVPMTGILFCSTTWEAKRFAYGIDRQLIGSGVRSLFLTFLEVPINLYKAEFGKIDPLLPYHLGGWIDFSTSNFSCLIEYIISTETFLKSVKEQGSIPEVRRWIRYCLASRNGGESLLSAKAKIAYRGEYLTNPLKYNEIFKERDELSTFIFGYSGVLSSEDYESTLDDILNYRGLHNAKPRIKHGLARKEERRRKGSFKRFQRLKKMSTFVLTQDFYGLEVILDAVKAVPDAPSYFSYPEILVKDSISYKGPLKKRTVVTFVKGSDIASSGENSVRTSIARTLESIRTGIWFHGSDPFIFRDLWRKKKSGYLVTEGLMPNLRGGIEPILPPGFRAFCPNAELFKREFTYRTGKIPLSHKIPESFLSGGLQMHQFRDAFDSILPIHLKGRWRSLLHDHKIDIKYIRALLAENNLRSNIEFETAILTINQVLSKDSGYIDMGFESSDVIPIDYFRIFERFQDVRLSSKLINTEMTIDDLIAEGFDDFSESSFEEDSDYLPDDLEVIQESEEDEDFEDLDLNELRRFKRSELDF
jgi:hypothetical protein